MSSNQDIYRLISLIEKDRTHGASELARKAAQVLKITADYSQARDARELLKELQDVEQQLVSTRPSMAPVSNIVNNILNIILPKAEVVDVNSFKRIVIDSTEKAIEDSIKAIGRIAKHGSSLITEDDRIMTHSYSSTVVAVLKEASILNKNIQVTITRSGAGRVGERMASELALYGTKLIFIDDTAAGLYVSQVDKVIVGADRVCADGGVVNGIGSYMLALASNKANIPFYVVCDMLKFDPRLNSSNVELEEKEPTEIVEPSKLPAGVIIINPYFDITPPELVTGVITEKGLMTSKEVVDYMSRGGLSTNIPDPGSP